MYRKRFTHLWKLLVTDEHLHDVRPAPGEVADHEHDGDGDGRAGNAGLTFPQNVLATATEVLE